VQAFAALVPFVSNGFNPARSCACRNPWWVRFA
jgi:hypothetical protein